MGELFEQIKGSTIVWIILSLATLLSLGWGIYSHLSANKKKQFSVAFSSFEIIKHGKNKIQNLKLMFNENIINNLTISKFAIWNSGNKVINSDDMVAGQGLEIYSDENTYILEAQIVTEIEPANSFKIIESTDHNVSIGFNYVDNHEGIVVQILHTGDKNSLHPRCKVKGGKAIKNYSTTSKRGNKPLRAKTRKIIFAVMSCTEAIIAFLMTLLLTLRLIDIKLDIIPETWRPFLPGGLEPESGANLSEANLILALVVLWIMVGILIFIVGKGMRDVFAIGVPSKLKLFATSIDDE